MRESCWRLCVLIFADELQCFAVGYQREFAADQVVSKLIASDLFRPGSSVVLCRRGAGSSTLRSTVRRLVPFGAVVRRLRVGLRPPLGVFSTLACSSPSRVRVCRSSRVGSCLRARCSTRVKRSLLLCASARSLSATPIAAPLLWRVAVSAGRSSSQSLKSF